MELIRKIEETSIVVDRSLDKPTEKELLMEFWFFETTTSTEFMLIHLSLPPQSIIFGQINYHRRLLEESSQ
jgi:hypothetical protein